MKRDKKDINPVHFFLKYIKIPINKGTNIQNCNSTEIVHNDPFTTPVPKSLNSSGFQNVKIDDCDSSQRIPLNERANLYFPKIISSKKDKNADIQSAGKILRHLDIKYFFKLKPELIQDIVTRKPLKAKNIGTPL